MNEVNLSIHKDNNKQNRMLTIHEETFCQYKALGYNTKQAYLKSGISEVTGKTEKYAKKLMGRPNIVARITEIKNDAKHEATVNALYTREEHSARINKFIGQLSKQAKIKGRYTHTEVYGIIHCFKELSSIWGLEAKPQVQLSQNVAVMFLGENDV